MIVVINLTVLKRLETACRDLALGKITSEAFERRLKELESDPEATRHDIAKIKLSLGMALLNLQQWKEAAWVLREAFVWQLPDGEKGLPLVCRVEALLGQLEEGQIPESELASHLGAAERIILAALGRLKEGTALYEQVIHLQTKIETAKRELDTRGSSISPATS